MFQQRQIPASDDTTATVTQPSRTKQLKERSPSFNQGKLLPVVKAPCD
jgi:hypothetical protein